MHYCILGCSNRLIECGASATIFSPGGRGSGCSLGPYHVAIDQRHNISHDKIGKGACAVLLFGAAQERPKKYSCCKAISICNYTTLGFLRS